MKSNTTTMLLLAAAIAFVGSMGLKKVVGTHVGDVEYVPGTKSEYHPTAYADRQDAAEALRETGFQAASGESIADVFEPQFESGKSVAFDVRLSHEQIESGDPTEVHAAMSILAGQEGAASQRPPLDIALVIDRSGSMLADDKMQYAQAASHALIDSLKANDRLSIISYSTDVDTHVMQADPARERAALHKIIDDLACHGGTNISAGLQAAQRALGVNPERLSRIVLLSDGKANNGVTVSTGLAHIASESLERGISVSSMGMGLDYDEVVMQAIARAGAGNYHFIDDVGETSEVFADELKDLTGAVARSAVLEVKLAPQVLLEDVHGFSYRRTADGFEVPLDSFSSGERKDLVVALDVETDEDEARLLTASLRYTDVANKRADAITKTVRVETGWSAKPFVPVMKRVQQIRTIEAFQEAMELYDKGRRFEAADLLEDQREENREFLDDADIEDRAFERVDGKLTQLAEALRKTEVHSTRGKWLKKATFNYANSAVQNQVVF